MTGPFRENVEDERFELEVEGHVAFIAYRIVHGEMVLVHTEVPEALGGRGVGADLARRTFALLRSTGRKALVTCPYLVAWLGKHPEDRDVGTPLE
ncbi:GNAT family N-acetyltransferase [Prosthecomicrobium pneumaticum]|uniref:N-acetyltransferase domain-containing protein n=1 Tax=Prosthecomicrobium pneumaticum TaxID=81895 RepID=A0A7W9FJN4_9HYPH|nr:GNAT family N-acetyltransferase [Prosthecomicrobium pneumaticum]MBB5751675.1 hypothetical protein [Prosthecomicrobium pneumaticum]